MNLDLRIPMGMMFTMMGAVLTAFGMATRDKTGVFARVLGVNADFWWGLVLLCFGIIVLILGRRAQARMEGGQPPRARLAPGTGPAARGRLAQKKR